MNINQLLLTLAADPSRNGKEAILLENKDNELLKKVILSALDPRRNYFIKKIPAYSPDTSFFKRDLNEAIDALGDLSSRKVTGHAAINHLIDILNSVSVDDAEVIVKIVRRDLRCGFSTSTTNKIWKKLVPDWPCLLCSPFEEKLIKKMPFPAYDQLKADGLRFNGVVIGDSCEFYSRSGSPIILQDDTLANELVALAAGRNVMFDGEMVCYRDGVLLSRKEGNGIANKGIKGTISAEESKLINVVLWDVIPYEDFVAQSCDIEYEDRLNLLTSLIEAGKFDKIALIESTIVNSFEEAVALFNARLAKGLEGDIIKSKRGKWSDSRSKDQIKLKAEKECDLRVTGWNYGEVGGKYEKVLGSLQCESEDGLVLVNVSGFTDDQRNTITKENSLNRIVAVMYNERITKKNGGVDSLFLPRIIEFREDKHVADTSDLIK